MFNIDACLYTFRFFAMKLPDETLEQGRNQSQSQFNIHFKLNSYNKLIH